MIADSDRLLTTATAPEVGTYVFALTATDGALTAADSISVNVTSPVPTSFIPGIASDGIRSVGPIPVRTTAEIQFGVQREGARTLLTLHDVAGRRLTTLSSNARSAGTHRVSWNGRDSNGERVSSGIYFLLLQVDGRAFTSKIVVVR